MPSPPSLVNKDPPGQVTLQGKLCSQPALVELLITSHKHNEKRPRPSSGRRCLAFQAGIVQVSAPSWINKDITAVGGDLPHAQKPRQALCIESLPRPTCAKQMNNQAILAFSVAGIQLKTWFWGRCCRLLMRLLLLNRPDC